jgi:hypothetical protein
MSRLVQAHFRDLVTREGSAVLALRREAAGPCGGLFPALDAGITLTPAGEQATVLELAGAYRPPLGAAGDGLDRVILHRVAAETARTLMNRVAGAVAHLGGTAERERGLAGAAPSLLPPAAGQHSWDIAMGGILVAGKPSSSPPICPARGSHLKTAFGVADAIRPGRARTRHLLSPRTWHPRGRWTGPGLWRHRRLMVSRSRLSRRRTKA